MEIIEYISRWSLAINGIMAPALAVFIIPKYLREKTTGRYIGFKDRVLAYVFVVWSLISAILIVPGYGVSIEALLRIILASVTPFVLALVFVKMTDVFGWDKRSQIRR